MKLTSLDWIIYIDINWIMRITQWFKNIFYTNGYNILLRHLLENLFFIDKTHEL